MSHQRTLIRNKIKDLLKGTSPSYNTSADDRVYTNRTNIKKVLPQINIYDETESAISRDISRINYIKTLLVKIDITVEANTDYDVLLDDVCKEVEDILKINPQLGGLSHSCIYLGTEMNHEAGGEKPISQAILSFEIKYLT